MTSHVNIPWETSYDTDWDECSQTSDKHPALEVVPNGNIVKNYKTDKKHRIVPTETL